jgi:hypothetical protein
MREWLEPASRPRWLVPAALVAALVAAAAFIYAHGTHLSFYVDEWAFLIDRRGHSPAVFLDPDNGHLVAVPILIYKLLFALFGAGSYVPFRALALGFQLASATLLFVLLRRRVGDGIALAGTILLLFLGPAWEPIISPVSIITLSSLVTGLGMLVLLDGRRRRTDALACLLLAVSLASFSYGPAFAVAAAVQIALEPGARRRAWVVLIPVALYALWLIGYEHSAILAIDIPSAPRAVFDSLGDDLVSLTGLYRVAGGPNGVLFDAAYAPLLALAFAAALGLSLVRARPRSAPRLYACAALALCFWVEIALVLDAGRTTSSSRYIYPGVAFVLLLAAEMARGRRLRPALLPVLAAVVAIALATYLPDLRGGAQALNRLGELDRSALAGLDLARGVVAPDFDPSAATAPALGNLYLDHVVARPYFEAVDSFGSPADTVAELVREPPEARAAADEVLAAALRLTSQPASGAELDCRALAPSPGTGVVVATVPRGGFAITTHQTQPAALRLRRFGDSFGPLSVSLPAVAGDARTSVPIPPDSAAVPWQVQVSGLQRPVQLCAVS